MRSLDGSQRADLLGCLLPGRPALAPGSQGGHLFCAGDKGLKDPFSGGRGGERPVQLDTLSQLMPLCHEAESRGARRCPQGVARKAFVTARIVFVLHQSYLRSRATCHPLL